MENNIDVYTVVFNDESDGEIYGISLVDFPANKRQFIALSEQEKHVQVRLADAAKQLLTGIVLIPEQQIYREFEDGTPFFLTFSAPVIEKFSQDFLMKGYQHNSTYNHLDKQWLSGTTIVESWIVNDPNNDKLNSLGFKDFPAGTWAITMKLDDSTWNEYVTNGKVKGFSIDSIVSFEKLKKKNKTQMKKEGFIQTLVKLLNKGKVECIDAETSIGILSADTFEIGSVVVDANLQPLVSSTFDMEDNTYVTDETGAITSITPIVEAPEAEIAPEMPAMEDMGTADDITVAVDEIVAVIAKPEVDFEALQTKIDALQAEVDALKAEKDALASQNMKLMEKAASLKIRSNSNVINLATKETKVESKLDAISRINKQAK